LRLWGNRSGYSQEDDLPALKLCILNYSKNELVYPEFKMIKNKFADMAHLQIGILAHFPHE